MLRCTVRDTQQWKNNWNSKSVLSTLENKAGKKKLIGSEEGIYVYGIVKIPPFQKPFTVTGRSSIHWTRLLRLKRHSCDNLAHCSHRVVYAGRTKRKEILDSWQSRVSLTDCSSLLLSFCIMRPSVHGVIFNWQNWSSAYSYFSTK